MTGPKGNSYRFNDVIPLIVDDSKHIRTLLRDVLFCFGCRRSMEAKDGSDALLVLKQNRIDVVFCNWMMSPMDGIEFIKHIRIPDSAIDPYIPIIMITAHATLDCIKMARDAGANAFITKPFTPGSIAKILTTIIESPRPFIRTKTYFGPDRRVKDFPYSGDDKRAQTT